MRQWRWLHGLPCNVEQGKTTGVDWSLVFDQLPNTPEEHISEEDPPDGDDTTEVSEDAANPKH